jgi:predicted membrane-bound dolichyl-phosphate-mannose-protein mannosyltransferase
MAASTKAPRQYQGIFDTILVKATVNPGTVASGAEVAGTVTATGAALGDFVRVAPGVDVVDVHVNAFVTAADTITWTVDNQTGDHVDLASSTWSFLVECLKGPWSSL